MRSLQTAAAVSRWRWFCTETKHQRSLMRKAMLKMLSRTTRAAFASWCTITKEHTRLAFTAQRVIVRMMNSKLLNAMDRWVQFSKDVRREHRVDARMYKLRMAQMLTLWAGVVKASAVAALRANLIEAVTAAM